MIDLHDREPAALTFATPPPPDDSASFEIADAHAAALDPQEASDA